MDTPGDVPARTGRQWFSFYLVTAVTVSGVSAVLNGLGHWLLGSGLTWVQGFWGGWCAANGIVLGTFLVPRWRRRKQRRSAETKTAH